MHAYSADVARVCAFDSIDGPKIFGFRIDTETSIQPVWRSDVLKKYVVRDRRGIEVACLYGILLPSMEVQGLEIADGAIRTGAEIASHTDFETHVAGAVPGHWIAVTEIAGCRRLYPDPAGGVPIVYAPELGRVGASADQILDEAEYHSRFLAERHRKFVGGARSGWISGTLTAHRGVSRLLPSHWLDLDSMQVERFWPRDADVTLTDDIETVAATVAQSLRQFVEACRRDYDCALTLTAGFDSRLLLAAARDVAVGFPAVTFGKRGDGPDQRISAQMAASFGFDHRLVPIATAPLPAQARWDRMNGDCVMECNRAIHPTLADIAQPFIVTGVVGETMRAYLYKDRTQTVNSEAVTAASLLHRLALPLDSEMEADFAKWLAPISHFPTSVVLDLAYLELRAGSWAMGQMPTQSAIRPQLMPYAQRNVQQAFLLIDPRFKADCALARRIGEIAWPEAMAFPINCYGTWQDPFEKVTRLFDMGRAVRYMRRKNMVPHFARAA
jgi:hypothetical protein